MNKMLIITALFVSLFLLWLGKAGLSLSNCLLDISEEYKEYPAAYEREEITREEFEVLFSRLREEDSNCQNETAKLYYLPNFLIKIITMILTKGKGLS